MTCRSVLAVAMLVLALPRVTAAQTATFSSRVEGVRLDVLVTENGRPITGLEAVHFEVRDQGVPQQLSLVSPRDVPVNVLLTLDLSRSVTAPQLARLRVAGARLLDGLLPGESAGLITFDHRVTERVASTSEVSRVRDALAAVTSDGDTALVDAAAAALLRSDADGGRTLIVLFSDGVDTASFLPVEAVIETARRVNGTVYAVWAGDGDPDFLREVTAATGGRVIDIGRGTDPAPAFAEVLNEFRSRYLLTYTPTGVAPGGWHEVDVRLRDRRGRIQTRRGYVSSAP